MPSNRRVRVYGTLAVVLFLAFLYFTRSSKHSDRSFYDRSVAGLERNRAQGPKPDHLPMPPPSPRIPPPAPDSGETLKAKANAKLKKDGTEGSAEDASYGTGRQPPQVALGQDSNSKRVKGADGWKTGKEDGKAKAKDEKTDEEREVEAELNSILKRSPIIIFSKTYCPYSQRAKQIFSLYSITPSPFVVELDVHKLGTQLQDQLLKLTGRRTVPNILISGTSIGGGDDIAALHEKGQLVSKIKDIGGKRIMEARLKGVKEKD